MKDLVLANDFIFTSENMSNMKSVFIYKNEHCTTSWLIAKDFGKDHKHVLDIINKILNESEKIGESSFRLSFHITFQDKKQPMYLLDKVGFEMIVLSFTGKIYTKTKYEYAKKFKEKEMKDLISMKNINNSEQPTTTSLKIAAHFNRDHFNVIRDIRNLECSDEFNQLNFEAVSYLGKNNQARPMYTLTFDGFMFLAMGYTGENAAKLKEDYIKAFNKYRKMATESLSPAQLILAQAQQLVDIENDIQDIKKDVKRIEQYRMQRDTNYDSMEKYFILKNVIPSVEDLQIFETSCIEISEIVDSKRKGSIFHKKIMDLVLDFMVEGE